ncbi:MAG: hypothetical protein NVSMB2_28930 [Chloroflexota bacterium]
MSVPSAVDCPFCDQSGSELISLFGSQLLTSQYRCTECGSYFEAVRRHDTRAERSVGPMGGDDGDSVSD